MNYNMPNGFFDPNKHMNMMNPGFDPMFKIQELEQEIFQLKGNINNLEKRVSALEENKIKKKNPSFLDSGVGNNSGSLYMI